jgi:hypothetical protein
MKEKTADPFPALLDAPPSPAEGGAWRLLRGRHEEFRWKGD